MPVSVSSKALAPTVTVAGMSEVTCGAGFCTVNVSDAELPPPGAGFTTRTWAVPADATSAAGIAALRDVELMKVVTRAVSFHCTVEPETKPLPLTVSSNAGLPTTTLDGLSAEATGRTFVIVNGSAADVPPPGAGFTTVTCAAPATARSAAGIAARSRPGAEYVVVRGEPFHWTTDPATKPDPFTVSVNAELPAGAVVGAIEISIGTGLLACLLLPSLPPQPASRTTQATIVAKTSHTVRGADRHRDEFVVIRPSVTSCRWPLLAPSENTALTQMQRRFDERGRRRTRVTQSQLRPSLAEAQSEEIGNEPRASLPAPSTARTE